MLGWLLGQRRPAFLDPGPMVDGDLELIAPGPRHVDDVLAACHHRLTIEQSPEDARITRDGLTRFLAECPGGRQPRHSFGDSPGYYFWMKLRDGPVVIGGGLGFRFGTSPDLSLVAGHLGYRVYPPARGMRLAERSCRLVLPLVRRHGFKSVWITANPDNIASRQTIERLGGRLIDTVPVPPTHELYARGDRFKCRYRLDV